MTDKDTDEGRSRDREQVSSNKEVPFLYLNRQGDQALEEATEGAHAPSALGNLHKEDRHTYAGTNLDAGCQTRQLLSILSRFAILI